MLTHLLWPIILTITIGVPLYIAYTLERDLEGY